MLAVLSPAKSLKYDVTKCLPLPSASPIFLTEANYLVNTVLKSKSLGDFKKLMKLSDALASRTFEEYQSYDTSNHKKETMAGLLFDGPAYRALNCETLSPHELEQGCKYVRFLSGLYGILKPNDMIQNHRLEMSTKLAVGSHTSLYDYWEQKLVSQINKEKNEYYENKDHQPTSSSPFLLLNIASDEYFKVISLKHLYPSDSQNNIKIVDCIFKDRGKIVSVYAKHARGLMARYICTNTELHSLLNNEVIAGGKNKKISSIETNAFDLINIITKFDLEGYEYDRVNSKILPDTQRSTLCFNRSIVVLPSQQQSLTTITSKEEDEVVVEDNNDNDDVSNEKSIKLQKKRKRT